nr:hypothetical protein [Nitratidesulfovibrio sp. HK-II]
MNRPPSLAHCSLPSHSDRASKSRGRPGYALAFFMASHDGKTA